MQVERKKLAELSYELQPIRHGYTDRYLNINLDDNTIEPRLVEPEVKEKFIGGRGYGLWYLWQATKADTKWNDSENAIIISPGPIGGITQYPGAGKSLVVTLSPITDLVIDSNVGGYFGPLMKFSGWDALKLQGKAQEDVIIYIDGNNGRVTIEKAPSGSTDTHLLCEELTELYAESEADKRHVSVVSTGSAAEHSRIGLLNFSFYDVKRKAVRIKQAGRGGIGTVFRDKRIKALVVKYEGVRGDSNNPADVASISKVGLKLHKEIYNYDDTQNQMRKSGTTFLAERADQFDILPVNNFKFGSHPDTAQIARAEWQKMFTINPCDGCWYGCTMACAKVIENFELKTGPYKGDKVLIDGPEYETIAAVGSNAGIFDREFIAEANFYCDTYGIDTISFGNILGFVMDCYEEGIINNEITGGLVCNFGNKDAALELLHQMSRGEGFGKIAGQGVRRLKEIFVGAYGADPSFVADIGMECKGLEYSLYMSKESLAQQGGYGLTNKGPQHDEAWLIYDDMINNLMPSFEDKAEALYYFPIFRTWFGLVGLCKLPWNDIKPIDNAEQDEPAKIPEHVENYVQLFNGVTGANIDKDTLFLQSERAYNFQRVFNLRRGYGRRVHDSIPYRSAGPVTVEEYVSRQERYDGQLQNLGIDITGKTSQEKVAILRKHREAQYQKLCDAVYKRRGWDQDGVPQVETLERLEIAYPELVDVIIQHAK